MSWNIKTPGDYINGPLTVTGTVTLADNLTVRTNKLIVNSTGVGIGATPLQPFHVKGVANFEAISGTTNVWQVYTYSDNTFRWNYNGSGSDELIMDSAGNMALGGGAPSAWGSANRALQVSGAVITSDSVLEGRFGNNCYYDGTNWKYIYGSSAAATNYRQVTGSHIWYCAPAGTGTISSFPAMMTLGNGGDLNLSTGNMSFASGKGIDFSATSDAAGKTSELFNDYEEGTWVGTLKGSVTDPTTQVQATGRYTKIGRMVQISIFFANVNTTGASGNISVSGLPFASANDGVGAWGTVTLHQAGTFTGYVSAEVGANSSNIFMPWSQSSGVSGYTTHSAGTGRYIAISTVYYV